MHPHAQPPYIYLEQKVAEVSVFLEGRQLASSLKGSKLNLFFLHPFPQIFLQDSVSLS